MVRIQNISLLPVLTAVVLTIFASPATAVDKTYLVNLNESWHLSSSWNPSGIPTTNDRVFIDVNWVARLSTDTAGVDGLSLSNGGEVRTSGFRLLVDGSASNAMTDILSGSRILVTPRTSGGTAFDTDSLTIHMGGLLDMAGGEVAVGNSLNISPNSIVAGDGVVNLFGTSSTKLFNRGTISAEGGTLTIRSIGGGTIALGGSPSTTSIVQAVDGASTLVIDGVLDEEFSDIINIGAGNTIQFDQIWETSAGTINFNAAGGVGTLGGAILTHGGTMNVNAGKARLDAPVVFDSTSVVNVGAGATLDFGQNVNALHGTVALNGGTTPAAAAVIDGFSQSMFATVDVDRIAQINVPTTFFDSATINLSDSDDALRLGSNSFFRNGVNFSGNGRLDNLPGSILRTEDSANIGVPLENQGRLNIGFGDSPGVLDAEGFTQTSTGTLEIELANITPGSFDKLTVQGNAILDGTLDVKLLGDFTPLLGNSFTILETLFGVVDGTFEVENVPEFYGQTLDVMYNSKSVVLEVIEVPASGDFDHDGDVDGNDFLVWQRGGSPNGTGSGDLALWQSQYGMGAGSRAPLRSSGRTPVNTAVPEPGAMLLYCLALLGFHACRGLGA